MVNKLSNPNWEAAFLEMVASWYLAITSFYIDHCSDENV